MIFNVSIYSKIILTMYTFINSIILSKAFKYTMTGLVLGVINAFAENNRERDLGRLFDDIVYRSIYGSLTGIGLFLILN